MVALTERAGMAAGRLAALPTERIEQLTTDAWRRYARASARLDGSPLADETADRVDAGSRSGPAAAVPEHAVGAVERSGERSREGPGERSGERSGGWSEALRLDRLPTQDVVAVEYANIREAVEVEATVAESFFDEPLVAVTRLHAALCRGLVADDAVARLRRTARAIHDGAQGKMLWSAPAPDRLPALMDQLLDWLGGRSADEPALTVAAVVHERLLEWQPFEAANGRLARAVSRVVRRARGLDVSALAVPEDHWLAATLDYHREIAATIRRRGDLTNWIERTVHVEALALEQAVDAAAGQAPPQPSARLVDLLAAVGEGGTLTDRDAAIRLGVSRERAVAELGRARRAGLVDDDLSVPLRRYRVARVSVAQRHEAGQS